MHVTACLCIHLTRTRLDKEKVARLRLSTLSLFHCFSLSLSRAFSPTKYVFICVNFCQKDSGNYHVWATGFPYFSLRSLLPQGAGAGVGSCSALELKEVWDFSRVLCINYRPTRRVPNQCLHFYLFCSVGEP